MLIISRACAYYKPRSDLLINDITYFNYHKAVSGYKMVELVDNVPDYSMYKDIDAKGLILPSVKNDWYETVKLIKEYVKTHTDDVDYLIKVEGRDGEEIGALLKTVAEMPRIKGIVLNCEQYERPDIMVERIKDRFGQRFYIHAANMPANRETIERMIRYIDGMDSYAPILAGLWGFDISRTNCDSTKLYSDYFDLEPMGEEDWVLCYDNCNEYIKWVEGAVNARANQ